MRHDTNKSGVLIGQPELFWLLLGNVRYSLGRMSMAPVTAQDLVKKFAHGLEPHQLDQIAKEVKRELEIRNEFREQSTREGRELRSGIDWLGMDFDHTGWEKFVDWCYEELGRR